MKPTVETAAAAVPPTTSLRRVKNWTTSSILRVESPPTLSTPIQSSCREPLFVTIERSLEAKAAFLMALGGGPAWSAAGQDGRGGTDAYSTIVRTLCALHGTTAKNKNTAKMTRWTMP